MNKPKIMLQGGKWQVRHRECVYGHFEFNTACWMARWLWTKYEPRFDEIQAALKGGLMKYA